MLCFPHTGVYAADQTFTDAVAFYDTYGSGQIVFSDGAFYYSSRGKEGNPKGTRYGVAGQRFTVEAEGDRRYVTEIALDDGSGSGSCKRISYIKKDGYCYSLYQVAYDRIFRRLRSKYSGTDFEQMMYNHQICFQIDFYLCLVLDGEDQGVVNELDNGRVTFTGTVYQSLDQILKAADWSEETKKALKNYYGIQLRIYQPSTWYVSYHKNDPAASGTMNRQTFTYGTAEKLSPCSFSKVITVTLDPGEGIWKGEKPEQVHTMLKSRFLGWSLKPKGVKQYSDAAKVKNLTDKHEETIHMYALWSQEHMKLPGMNCDGYEFLGWSPDKLPVLPADTGKEDIEKLKLYEEGSNYSPEKNTVLYAVWKQMRYKVQFQTPQDGRENQETTRNFKYGREEIRKIRELIADYGFAGFQLNQAIIRSGLV